MKRNILFKITLITLVSACTSNPVATEAVVTNQLTLTSDAFSHGQSIPAKYTCVGRDISPALAWNEPPADTQSFALIMEDLDAPGGVWVH